jgi:quercetin dioxygenase-like cupin family protein
MIERGLTSPSVSTLNKLAGALQVPITAFFRTDPVRERIVFCKASERTRIPFLRGMIEGLGGETFLGRVEAFLLTLENGGSSGPSTMLHSGSELVFCLRGNLEYEVENLRYALESGDSLLFSSQMNHRWRNPGPGVVNAIIVISSFDSDESPSEFHLAGVVVEEGESHHEDDGLGLTGSIPEEA